MDRNEKKRLREHIGEQLDVSGTRLTDYEAKRLADFVENYDDYRGQSEARTSSRKGWSSDGTYTRRETLTVTFTDDVGIRTDYAYQDNDGESGESSTETKNARAILNWLHDRK